MPDFIKGHEIPHILIIEYGRNRPGLSRSSYFIRPHAIESHTYRRTYGIFDPLPQRVSIYIEIFPIESKHPSPFIFFPKYVLLLPPLSYFQMTRPGSKPIPLLLLGGATVGFLAYLLKNYSIRFSRKPKKMEASTLMQSNTGKVLVATRIHLGQTSKTDMKDFDKKPLINFIREALTYADGVAVAVGVNDLFAPT